MNAATSGSGQGLLVMAEQCERLAAYKELTGPSIPAHGPAQHYLKDGPIT